jgi:DNA-binding response OmpR family regulator
VDSTLGLGTTFRIFLPRTEEEEKTLTAAEPAPRIYGRKRILVVEDQMEVLTLVAKTLENQGFDVLQATNPEEAVALIQEQDESIDLLLTDMVMPKGNGLQLASDLRAMIPRLKVLYMSGYSEFHEGIISSRDLGEGFLQKPFTPSILLEKVNAVFADLI